MTKPTQEQIDKALNDMNEGIDYEDYAKAYWLSKHWDTVVAALEAYKVEPLR